MLTHQLLRVLRRSVHARIVSVSSEAHRNVNAYDLKAVTTCQTEFRDHFTAYGVSKLAINLFTRHLAKKLSRKYTLIIFILKVMVLRTDYRHKFENVY